MRNIQEIVDTGQCVGCAACYAACTKGYIAYKADGGMGFPVPNVSDCENCGKCLIVCPSSDVYDEDA